MTLDICRFPQLTASDREILGHGEEVLVVITQMNTAIVYFPVADSDATLTGIAGPALQQWRDAAVEAGAIVVDARPCDPDKYLSLVVRGPMVAVGASRARLIDGTARLALLSRPAGLRPELRGGRRHDLQCQAGAQGRRMTIGQLESLAGIGPSHEERAAFWRPFAKLPGVSGFKLGCEELRRMARIQAEETDCPRLRRPSQISRLDVDQIRNDGRVHPPFRPLS